MGRKTRAAWSREGRARGGTGARAGARLKSLHEGPVRSGVSGSEGSEELGWRFFHPGRGEWEDGSGLAGCLGSGAWGECHKRCGCPSHLVFALLLSVVSTVLPASSTLGVHHVSLGPANPIPFPLPSPPSPLIFHSLRTHTGFPSLVVDFEHERRAVRELGGRSSQGL